MFENPFVSNEEIVGQLQEEFCPHAFEVLVERFSPLLWKLFRAYRVELFDYDDMVQEGRLILYEAVKTYEKSKNIFFAPYYNSLLLNHVDNLKRREQAEKRDHGGYFSLDAIQEQSEAYKLYGPYDKIKSDLDIPGDDRLIVQEQFNQFWQSLSLLEERILKAYINLGGYEEISQQLNLPVKVIRSALDRCKQKFKRYIR
ncbi:sigma-70 family RNA polymerase sigma factor [Hutsoniella sourekii]